MKRYSLQIDGHGHQIVCGDANPRNGYRVVFVGSYNECLSRKSA